MFLAEKWLLLKLQPRSLLFIVIKVTTLENKGEDTLAGSYNAKLDQDKRWSIQDYDLGVVMNDGVSLISSMTD